MIQQNHTTIRFDQSDASNGNGGGHPLRFYLDAAKTTQFTTGVTTSWYAWSSRCTYNNCCR